MSTQEVAEETDTDELSASEELYRIESARNDDGTVDVEVVDWEKNKESNNVTVEFLLPTGDKASETMDWPWPLSDEPSEYKFVRLCRTTGYGLVGAEELRGSNASVRASHSSRSGWTLEIPKQRSLGEKANYLVTEGFAAEDITGILSLMLISPAVLILGPLMLVDHTEPGEALDEEEYQLMVQALAVAVGCLVYASIALYFFA